MRILDLFSGIGGFSLAFERAGFTTAAFAEIEPFPCSVLRAHWPDVPNLGDVRGVTAGDVGAVDVVTFGSPCQDLSVAGKRAGLGGDRSSLFHEAIRIIRDGRPTFAVWENVPGAFASNWGRDFWIVLDSLAECGVVDIAWRVLDAQFAGVPQRRRRIFVVADFRAERAGEILSVTEGVRWHPAARKAKREDVAGTLGARTAGGGRSDDLDGHGAYIPFDLAQITSATNRNRAEPGQPQPPIVAGGNPHVAFNPRPSNVSPTRWGVRRLTPTECERLQGFPDGWTNVEHNGKPAADSPRYRALGNSVAVPVVEQIARRMAAALRGVNIEDAA